MGMLIANARTGQDDIIKSTSVIRATTTRRSAIIIIVFHYQKSTGLHIHTVGRWRWSADRKPPLLQFGREGKRVMTYRPNAVALHISVSDIAFIHFFFSRQNIVN